VCMGLYVYMNVCCMYVYVCVSKHVYVSICVNK